MTPMVRRLMVVVLGIATIVALDRAHVTAYEPNCDTYFCSASLGGDTQCNNVWAGYPCYPRRQQWHWTARQVYCSDVGRGFILQVRRVDLQR